jgi:hypothetical protein
MLMELLPEKCAIAGCERPRALRDVDGKGKRRYRSRCEVHRGLHVEKHGLVKRESFQGFCEMPGCENVKEQKGKGASGEALFRRYCAKHHAMREASIGAIGGGFCSRCGWSGAVHRHRLDGSGPYVVENIEVLCPNCHEAIHGRGAWNQKQVYDSKV